MPDRAEIRRSFPFLTASQVFILEQKAEQFLGFDAKERPVLKREDGNGVNAINKRGEIDLAQMPITRAYLQQGEFELAASVKLVFKVNTEFGFNNEVEDHVRKSVETRNRIARKLEELLRLGTGWSDYEVGWLDENRSIDLNPDSLTVTVRAIGVETKEGQIVNGS